MISKDLIEYYLSLGFSIIPCKPKSKIPLVSWKKYQEVKPSRREIYEWFDNTDNNIAVVLGKVSNYTYCLDFDNLDYYNEIVNNDLEKETLVVLSGSMKGKHVYFRSDRQVKSLRSKYVELKGEGNIVVLPNSIHPETLKEYQFINKVNEIPLIRDLENAFIQKFKVNTILNNDYAFEDITLKGIPPCIKLIREGVNEGLRNNMCMVYASYLFQKGYNFDKILLKVLEMNKKNKPPLPDKEIFEIVKSLQKGKYRFGCSSIPEQYCIKDKCRYPTIKEKLLQEKLKEIKGENTDKGVRGVFLAFRDRSVFGYKL